VLYWKGVGFPGNLGRLFFARLLLNQAALVLAIAWVAAFGVEVGPRSFAWRMGDTEIERAGRYGELERDPAIPLQRGLMGMTGLMIRAGRWEEGAAAVSGRYGIGPVDVAPGDLKFDPVRKA
jgi:hypothetical protein